MKSLRQLIDVLGIKYPIIQAPMAGISTPKLAAAVHGAGGLGSIAFGPFLSNQSKIDKELREFKELTGSSIVNINFFAHAVNNDLTDAQEKNWYKLYNNKTEGIKLKNGGISYLEFETSDEYPGFLNKLISYKPKVVSFHFGLPSSATIEKLKENGILVFASATSIPEVNDLVSHGVDGLVLQGYEAGGHRGNYIEFELDENLSTWALFQHTLKLNPDCYIVPAGGIVSGDDVKLYLTSGASAVQVGTAFVATQESANNKDFIKSSTLPTIMTDLVSGRPARCIRTPFIDLLIDNSADAPKLPPFQYSYFGYKQWKADKGPDYGFYLVGQNYKLIEHGLTTEQVMANLTNQL